MVFNCDAQLLLCHLNFKFKNDPATYLHSMLYERKTSFRLRAFFDLVFVSQLCDANARRRNIRHG
jgi:hypothetical protein